MNPKEKKIVLVLTVEETRQINGALDYIAAQFAKHSWRDGGDILELAHEHNLLNCRIAQQEPQETDLPYLADVDDVTKSISHNRIMRLAGKIVDR